jgi:hypothetical protein
MYFSKSTKLTIFLLTTLFLMKLTYAMGKMPRTCGDGYSRDNEGAKNFLLKTYGADCWYNAMPMREEHKKQDFSSLDFAQQDCETQ